jgi:hypothetical protein
MSEKWDGEGADRKIPKKIKRKNKNDIKITISYEHYWPLILPLRSPIAHLGMPMDKGSKLYLCWGVGVRMVESGRERRGISEIQEIGINR